ATKVLVLGVVDLLQLILGRQRLEVVPHLVGDRLVQLRLPIEILVDPGELQEGPVVENHHRPHLARSAELARVLLGQALPERIELRQARMRHGPPGDFQTIDPLEEALGDALEDLPSSRLEGLEVHRTQPARASLRLITMKIPRASAHWKTSVPTLNGEIGVRLAARSEKSVA